MGFSGLWAGLLMAASFLVASPATAGRPCEEVPPNAQQTLSATRMAEQTLDKLNGLPDKVVLIGRVGQDLSKYGLEYSHMGFAIRQGSGWGVVHELNACGTAHSSLYEQGLVDFFSDSPFKYKAGIWRLGPGVQERLIRAIQGKTAKRMHEEKYNMLAYPFSTKYQNSNAWVLEVLAFGMAAEDEVATRADAQAWLKQNGYTPTQLAIGTMTRLGARITRANIAFDDHPDELRWNGKIQTVTVASVIAFLGKLPGACLDSRCSESNITLASGSYSDDVRAEVNESWYVGTFIGEMADVNEATQFMVQCVNVSACEVSFKNASPQPQLPQRMASLQVKPFDDQIANSNLDTTRSAAYQKPLLYSDPRFGGLLRPIRSLLESGKRLDQCVDISKNHDGFLAFCRVAGGDRSQPILLVATMNSACGSEPFCAYYFIPLSLRTIQGSALF